MPVGKKFSHCGICDTDVGALRRTFGKHMGDPVIWVRSQHRNRKAGERRCAGSSLEVTPDKLLDAPKPDGADVTAIGYDVPTAQRSA